MTSPGESRLPRTGAEWCKTRAVCAGTVRSSEHRHASHQRESTINKNNYYNNNNYYYNYTYYYY